MGMQTRENPDNGRLEVLHNGQWVDFEAFRQRQIDEAYDNSIRFLRERLGEEYTNREMPAPDPAAGG
ncbi:MAG: hypothetical protein ACKV2V_29705 [Blastocatellia bacterium]